MVRRPLYARSHAAGRGGVENQQPCEHFQPFGDATLGDKPVREGQGDRNRAGNRANVVGEHLSGRFAVAQVPSGPCKGQQSRRRRRAEAALVGGQQPPRTGRVAFGLVDRHDDLHQNVRAQRAAEHLQGRDLGAIQTSRLGQGFGQQDASGRVRLVHPIRRVDHVDGFVVAAQLHQQPALSDRQQFRAFGQGSQGTSDVAVILTIEVVFQLPEHLDRGGDIALVGQRVGQPQPGHAGRGDLGLVFAAHQGRPIPQGGFVEASGLLGQSSKRRLDLGVVGVDGQQMLGRGGVIAHRVVGQTQFAPDGRGVVRSGQGLPQQLDRLGLLAAAHVTAGVLDQLHDLGVGRIFGGRGRRPHGPGAKLIQRHARPGRVE